VLPTLTENFGLAVAEALAAGVPAVVTKGAPWSGLETERCGWWIDHGVEPLEAALRVATALPRAERQEMGLRGRAYVARDFAWEVIAREMISVYRWVVGCSEKPSFVV
jgi:glycosyltransferase involved in cell wall biosynthesis